MAIEAAGFTIIPKEGADNDPKGETPRITLFAGTDCPPRELDRAVCRALLAPRERLGHLTE